MKATMCDKHNQNINSEMILEVPHLRCFLMCSCASFSRQGRSRAPGSSPGTCDKMTLRQNCSKGKENVIAILGTTCLQIAPHMVPRIVFGTTCLQNAPWEIKRKSPVKDSTSIQISGRWPHPTIHSRNHGAAAHRNGQFAEHVLFEYLS